MESDVAGSPSPADVDERSVDLNPQKWLDDHGSFLYRFALTRVSDKHVAEDLVQETFLGAIATVATFEGKCAIRTWMTSILKRKIVDYFRKNGRSLQYNQEDKQVLSNILDPKISNSGFQSLLERKEFIDVLRRCISQLPTHLAEVFEHRMRSEQTQNGLAEILEITEKNLAVRLFRARVLLRKCLEKSWMGKPFDL
ncbi:MAG: sigma-70 family RNA polymerase sigma factor [Pirellulaceae bacterium]